MVNRAATYWPAISLDPRLIGGKTGAPDFAVRAPVFKVRISGGVVNNEWNWQGHSKFLDMQVDRANGWALWSPGYIDCTPLPATLTLEIPRHLPRRRPPSRPMERRRLGQRRGVNTPA